jgi:multidrug efflux pump subunit AcrA (membrane-fusion protein)
MTSSLPSNSSQLPNPRPTLQVVPPSTLQPTQLPEETPKVTTEVSVSTSSPKRLLLILGTIIGVGALGFIPVPQTVNGNAEITSTPTARQIINMPRTGQVQLLVHSNQSVEINQPIALIKSEEFNKDFAETTRQFDQVQSEVALSKQQIGLAEANFKEALAREATSRQKTTFIQEQLTQLSQGKLPPQMQDLQSQQAAIKSEIVALQNNLNMISGRLNRYQEGLKSGWIPQNQVEDLQQQQNNLKQQIQEKQHQIAAKAAQMDVVKQNLQQDLSQKQAEDAQTVAAVQSAMQQVKQAVANVQIRQQVANQRAVELKRVQSIKEDLILTAKTSGIVVTPDLDQQQNQYLQASSKLLEIVDLKQLMVKVQIKPEDLRLVSLGQKVTFRPQGQGLIGYQGKVQKIDAVMPSDGGQHPSIAIIYVSLSNSDNSLRPGFPGHAHIEVESSLLYQKLQREFEKLVPINKFF